MTEPSFNFEEGRVIVFKGIVDSVFVKENGGSIMTPESIKPDDVFGESYTQRFYIVLTPTKVKGIYVYQLEEYDAKNKIWYQEQGSATLLSDRLIAINESDGSFGQIAYTTLYGKESLVLYRVRPSRNPFIAYSTSIRFSSLKSRNKHVRVVTKYVTKTIKEVIC